MSLGIDEQWIKDLAPDDPGETPDELYEQQVDESIWEWAMDRTRELFESTGRGIEFEIFLARTFQGTSHEKLAARFGVSDALVRSHLSDVRGRISEEARAEIRQGTATEEGFKAQWEAFLRGKRA